eukprot:5540005-Pyramimonas_sp.AAC.1
MGTRYVSVLLDFVDDHLLYALPRIYLRRHPVAPASFEDSRAHAAVLLSCRTCCGSWWHSLPGPADACRLHCILQQTVVSHSIAR